MVYEIYKKLLSKEEYFNTWETDSVQYLNDALMEHIYKKYMVKTLVFQRDEFKCQNENCPYCKNVKDYNKLTMHHVKWRKNGGQDKLKNGVTLCNGSHKNFHRGKCSLTFWDATYKIDGMTSHKSNINWKEIKAKNKKIRKSISLDEKGILISSTLMLYLMKFLEYEYSDIFDTDENDMEE
jgi:hypothetical protein